MLPHAFPFRFVDVLPTEIGGRLEVCLSANATVSRGHPYAVALGLEILAQAAVALLGSPGDEGRGRLAGIDGARWHRALTPGERLRARAEVVGRFQRLAKVRALLETESGEVALEADLLLAVVE